MATTTNYGWDTPDDTDLVKDGAAAIRTLGSSVDTTTKNLNPQTTTGALAYRSATANVNTALPIGTANQVLRVNSGGTAPEWATTADQTPLTTKGDLFGFDTADARIPIGTNGHILTADSTQSLGLKWAAPASGSFVGCGLYASADQTLTGGVDTAITFNSEYFDSDAFHSTSSNTSRITIPAGLGGKYLFAYSAVNTASAEANYNTSTLRKNGSAITEIKTLWSSVTYTTMTQTVIIDLVATDYIELYIESDANATIKNYRTFYCQKVG